MRDRSIAREFARRIRAGYGCKHGNKMAMNAICRFASQPGRIKNHQPVKNRQVQDGCEQDAPGADARAIER